MTVAIYCHAGDRAQRQGAAGSGEEAEPVWKVRASTAARLRPRPAEASGSQVSCTPRLGRPAAHLEEQWVLADALNGRQQVALQGDVRGLPASQQHTALQRNRDPH